MDYEILSAHGWANDSESRYSADEKLEVKVKEYIAKGWRPQGGVSISVSNDENEDYGSRKEFNRGLVTVYQAVVKD